MNQGAGVLYLTADNQALFLLRGDGSDFPRHWCFPGGTREAGETLEECARRESLEELGSVPENSGLKLLARSASQGVDYTTFVTRIKEPIIPKVDGEHLGYSWAPVNTPPAPLHPGCQIAINCLSMDELGIAECIRDGLLTSPQKFENVFLFAMRVTGTGVSYRKALDEFVIRDPSIYLNDRFLQRCNGLPVIIEHPDGAMINSDEFKDRIVGTIMLPYIQGDEVWAITRMYDTETIQMMLDDQLSTSPAVVFKPGINTKVKSENGDDILIEGIPFLLDHLAICRKGVWDKGREPAGVLSTGANDVTEEEKKAAEAKAKADAEAAEKVKADAEAGQKIDKLLAGIDGLNKLFEAQSSKMDAFEKRMDAFETAKKDSDKDDKKDGDDKDKDDGDDKDKDDKKDGDDKDKDDKKDGEGDLSLKDKRKDAKKDARKDSDDDFNRLRNRLDDIEKRTPVVMSDEDNRAIVGAQENADRVFQAFGDSAPRPLNGESLLAYRKRMADKLKPHSSVWKGVDLSSFSDEQAFGAVEKQIYADAYNSAIHPVGLPEGKLRSVTRRSHGREITEFYGEPKAWMGQFSAVKRRLVGIRKQ